MKKRLSMIVHYKKYSKKIMVVAVAILIAIGLFSFTFSGFTEEKGAKCMDDTATREIIGKALKAMQEKRIDSAEKLISDYLEAKPAIVPDVFYLMLGSVYCAQKRLDDAINILEQGHKSYPDNDKINKKWMNCCAQRAFEEKEFIEAGKLYENICETYPQSWIVLERAATSYCYAGRISDLKRIYNKLADLSVENDILWLETVIRVGGMLGYNEECEIFKNRLRETGIYSDLVSSEKPEISQGQDNNKYNIEKLLGVSDIDQAPIVIEQVAPIYPTEAKMQGITGVVILRFIVTKEGNVKDAMIIKSEPEGIFDQSSLDAIRYYRFNPAKKNGEDVDVIMTEPIVYSIVGPAVKAMHIL